MIRELIEYYLTPASPAARKNGYLYEAIAFQMRGQRNQKNWKAHWAHCHGLVKDFCDQHAEAKSLTILGSGCLFEVPKDWLKQRFERIVLVDQVFPRTVRNWAASSTRCQIELCEFDLSKKFSPTEFSVKTDLVFSANLLSQLPIRPIAQEMKVRTLSDEQQNARRFEIEDQHLSFLKKLGAPVLLWTDVERLYCDRQTGEALDSEKTVLRELPSGIAQWQWRLAPAPEWHPQLDVMLKMQAVVL